MLYYHIGSGAEAFTAGRNDQLPYHVIQGHQIHKDHIAVIERPDTTREELEGYDAFVTQLPDCAIGVRTADCVPVLLYDPVRRVVAAVHSGWRSTVLRISQKTIQLMTERFGTSPSDLIAIIGPCICHDSYQVGKEVIDAFIEAGFDAHCWTKDKPTASNCCNGQSEGNDVKYHLDLWIANTDVLMDAGVELHNIRIAGICTFTDENYYSARREGNQHDKRNINAIRLTVSE
ncbi:MAG: peptidoglycan editing factor PgeF [Bacteroidales bacterium]|nr:peptidoglycan editing factor PgeF [Candidatus Liminaster caballi]